MGEPAYGRAWWKGKVTVWFDGGELFGSPREIEIKVGLKGGFCGEKMKVGRCVEH